MLRDERHFQRIHNKIDICYLNIFRNCVGEILSVVTLFVVTQIEV
jgi:hypothetical protein